MATREHGLFRRVDHPGPDVAKGGCYFDFSTGPGVDTGILIDFEGTLFFSIATVRSLAEVAGFSLNEEAEQLETDNAFLYAECERKDAEIAELRAQLDTVSVFISRAVADAEKSKTPKAKPEPKTAAAK